MSGPTYSKTGARVVWSLVVLLIILHQDVWFWESDYLVLGIMPIGLFYHACISIAAGIVWYLATVYAWPLDDVNAESQGGAE